MRRTAIAGGVFALAAAIAGAAWAASGSREEVVQPIEPVKVTNPAKVELGKKLFFDPRLSKSGFISCNSCHNLSMGGSDNLAASIGEGHRSNRQRARIAAVDHKRDVWEAAERVAAPEVGEDRT